MEPIEIDSVEAARAGFDLGLRRAPTETVDFIRELMRYCRPIEETQRLSEPFDQLYGAGLASQKKSEFASCWKSYLERSSLVKGWDY